LTNRIIERAKDREDPIRKSEIYAFNRNIGNLEDNIADFIAWHYTLTDREDTPFWKKNKELGIKENHKEKCWEAYRKKENYIGGSVYPDYMWAMLCVSMGKLDDEVELNTRPELLEKASVMFEANRKMAEQNGKYAPHIYDWSQKFLFDGKTHEEVLEEALARVSRNKY
jgi:hypothetical protein